MKNWVVRKELAIILGASLSVFAGVLNSADGDLTLGEIFNASLTTIAGVVVRQNVWSQDGHENEVSRAVTEALDGE